MPHEGEVLVLSKLFQRLFGPSAPTPAKPDLRYAHPSHADHTPKPAAPKPKPAKMLKAPTNAVLAMLKDTQKLQDLTLTCIQDAGSKGLAYDAVNRAVLQALTGIPQDGSGFDADKSVRARLGEIRRQMKEAGKIGYNAKQAVWYVKKANKPAPKDPTKTGWKPIKTELEAIKYLHANLTPLQFEHFCAEILTNHCKVPIKVTEKRPGSGADGGFDGIGEYTIDGQIQPVVLQVKRTAPNKQVGSNDWQCFIGAALLGDYRHCIMMTTGTFSANLMQAVAKSRDLGFQVELVDQNRLAHIMLSTGDNNRGFGLYRAPDGKLWLNTKILSAAGRVRE